ncbi:site-specific integrase [Glaciimonas sp. PCH181]|uniref:tyrosine-type recombinase/integrase n=1 Tax=Glaciimonas sp. PCH181 TaxID=2133943 RepID=UPI000D3CAAA0|nr:site-specific integrase [Glaciimonas sp. PCH181]PUA19630.1 site-specific integrase [Glaciimonas sp. PCH181]
MPIYRDKTRGCYRFEFNRIIEGRRVRARKYLPQTWTQTQADTFDRKESARLYAIGTSVERVKYTIEDAVNIYLVERIPKLKSGKNVASELSQMLWAYQGKSILELSDACKFYTANVGRSNESIGTPLAPATIRNRIRQLASACRYGWKHYGMCENDPAANIIVPEVNNARQQYIDRVQMLEIAKTCTSPNARLAVRIAFYSGMRLGEILRAKVRGDTFYLSDSKNRTPRLIPIHPKILVCVRKFNQATPKITIQRSFMKARKICDLDHITFHDLRHSAASAMINAGVDLYTVGRILGHKDSRSTQRYSHLAIDTLAAAVGKIGKRKPG